MRAALENLCPAWPSRSPKANAVRAFRPTRRLTLPSKGHGSASTRFDGWASNPAFFATASVSIALGIGANTAAFSVVYAVLLRSLPVQNPASLAVVSTRYTGFRYSMAYPACTYLRDHSSSLDGLVAFRAQSLKRQRRWDDGARDRHARVRQLLRRPRRRAWRRVQRSEQTTIGCLAAEARVASSRS